jgi:hypothetical protein
MKVMKSSISMWDQGLPSLRSVLITLLLIRHYELTRHSLLKTADRGETVYWALVVRKEFTAAPWNANTFPIPVLRGVADARQYTTGLNTAAMRIVRDLEDAVGSPMPDFIEPLLATLRPAVPKGERWVHEIKFDGYRMQLHRSENLAKFFTRRGHDWSRKMPKVTEAAFKLPNRQFILDGEVVVLADDGTTDFNELERELGAKDTESVTYYVFDLLYLDGFDLRKVPLIDRKRALAELIALVPADGPIRYSEHMPGGEGMLGSTHRAFGLSIGTAAMGVAPNGRALASDDQAHPADGIRAF